MPRQQELTLACELDPARPTALSGDPAVVGDLVALGARVALWWRWASGWR